MPLLTAPVDKNSQIWAKIYSALTKTFLKQT